jgi:maleylpyruvate isomerase
MSGDEPATDLPRSDGLERSLDELAASTDRLLGSLDRLTEEDVRGPSLLPGWTRAHVLTHIARNADGLAVLANNARTGADDPMYPGAPDQRELDIEAGSGRGLGDLRLDVADSADRLMAAFADFPDEARAREVVLRSGARAYGWEIPVIRVRELEIHHVDLDAGYTPDDWSPDFAARTLDQLSPFFRDNRDCPVGVLAATDGDGRWEVATAGPTLAGPRSALVGWLTGRTSGEGLALDPPGELPRAPRWG